MALNKALFPPLGNTRSNEVHISGVLTIGAAGALSTYVGEGTTAVKTGGQTGRYTVTFARKYKNVRIEGLVLTGPTTAALTSTDGWFLSSRNVSGTSFDIQASQVSLADANPTSGNLITWHAWVQQ